MALHESLVLRDGVQCVVARFDAAWRATIPIITVVIIIVITIIIMFIVIMMS